MSRPHLSPSVAHRLTAVLGVALVLALNLLAVCPEAHAWLHAAAKVPPCAHGHTHARDPAPATDGARSDERATDSDNCVIVQFADGAVGPTAAPALISAPLPMRLATLPVVSEFAAAAPAHFLPPGCGPPAA